MARSPAWGDVARGGLLWICAAWLSRHKIRETKNVSSLTTETLWVSFLNGAPETILHPHSGLNLHFFPHNFQLPREPRLFKSLPFSWGLSLPCCGFEDIQIQIHSTVLWKVTFLFDWSFLTHYTPNAAHCNSNIVCQKWENRSQNKT